MTYKGPLPILDQLETDFAVVLAQPGPKIFGRGEIIGLVVQNPLTFPDGTTNVSEIFVGSGTNMIYFMIPGQESPYIAAEDLKDLYVRLNFPASNPNGGVLTADVEGNNRGLGYTIGDVLTLDGFGDGNAEVTVATLRTGVLSGAINNAGTGYTIGDILTIDGGICTIRVLTVGGAGEILTFEFVFPSSSFFRGDGYTVSTQDLNGGTGTLATFDITELTNAITSITVTAPGVGYQPGDESEASGGTGTGALVVVLTVETVVPESANVNLIIYRKRKGGLQ